MGSELSSAADFGHLDGSLVFPLFIDEYHVLVTEDGAILVLPAGMHVHFAGRIGIRCRGRPLRRHPSLRAGRSPSRASGGRG
jgi:hypothetical protein